MSWAKVSLDSSIYLFSGFTNTHSLALAEIYIVLGHLFRRFDLSLHDTVRERDIDVVRDAFIGEVSWKSKGVKVKLAEPSKQS